MTDHFKEKITPSWDDINTACKHIVTIVGQYEKPDYVVGLTRGGLIPAVMISHMLEVPMIPISYSSTKGEGEFKQYPNDLPVISSPMVSGTGNPQAPIIFFIDDIIDTGNTMNEVQSEYLNRGHKIYTASIHYKEGANFIPNIYWKQLPADAPWVVYPWEY